MPNAGYPSAREKVAERLKRDTGIEYTANSILMTVGCAGAMNTALKSLRAVLEAKEMWPIDSKE